jgi:hypothetical protein
MKKQIAMFVMSLVAPAMAQVPSLESYVPAQNGETCAGLSGLWKGKCSDGKDKVTYIEQKSCRYFKIDGKDVVVGGLESASTVIPAGTLEGVKAPLAMSVSSAYDWNEKRDTLQFHGALLARVVDAKSAQPASFNGEYRLNGAKLELVASAEGAEYSCTFDKQ